MSERPPEPRGYETEEQPPQILDVLLIDGQWAQTVSTTIEEITVLWLDDGSRETISLGDYKREEPISSVRTIGDLLDKGLLSENELRFLNWRGTTDPEVKREAPFWGGLRKRESPFRSGS